MEATRCAVQVFPWPVGSPMRLSDAAMCSSDQRPAMLRITAKASSVVAQPCSPVRACARAVPSAGRRANGLSARRRARRRRRRLRCRQSALAGVAAGLASSHRAPSRPPTDRRPGSRRCPGWLRGRVKLLRADEPPGLAGVGAHVKRMPLEPMIDCRETFGWPLGRPAAHIIDRELPALQSCALKASHNIRPFSQVGIAASEDRALFELTQT